MKIYVSRNASHIATMFSGGTSAWMLCTVLKTKPPPGASASTLRRTSSFTCLRRAVRQHALRVYAAAPEDDVLAKVALERDRLHARRADVHRVENVHAHLDEIGQQRADVAARVKEELGVRRQLLDALEQRP